MADIFIDLDRMLAHNSVTDQETEPSTQMPEMSEEEKENRQQEVNTIQSIMKDHAKMSSIIANRLN